MDGKDYYLDISQQDGAASTLCRESENICISFIEPELKASEPMQNLHRARHMSHHYIFRYLTVEVQVPHHHR